MYIALSLSVYIYDVIYACIETYLCICRREFVESQVILAVGNSVQELGKAVIPKKLDPVPSGKGFRASPKSVRKRITSGPFTQN